MISGAITPILFVPRTLRSDPLHGGNHLCILPLPYRIIAQLGATRLVATYRGALPLLLLVHQSLSLRSVGAPRKLLQSRHPLL